MFRKVYGLILSLLGVVLLLYLIQGKITFEWLGLGDGTSVFEIGMLIFTTINFIAYTIVVLLLFKGIKLIRE